MKSGVCPKCGSRNIYTNIGNSKKSKFVAQGHGLLISQSYLRGFNFVSFDDYVCTDCGYVESYILNEEKLKDIRDLWSRIGEDNQKRKHDEP